MSRVLNEIGPNEVMATMQKLDSITVQNVDELKHVAKFLYESALAEP